MVLSNFQLLFSVSHWYIWLINWHFLSQRIFGTSQIVGLLQQFLLVNLLTEKVCGVEGAHTLHHDFVREHGWSLSAALGAFKFYGCDVKRVPRDWLVQCWIKVTFRRNVDQQILAWKLVRRTGWLLLSVPELLTFVIYLCQMRSRILLIPSQTLLLRLSSLWPWVGHSILLSDVIWSSDWGQFLGIYVGRLVRADHSSISIAELITFTFVCLEHWPITRCCIHVLDGCICGVKVVTHVFVILDERHLGAWNQATWLVAWSFGVA